MPEHSEASLESVTVPAPGFSVREYARTAVGSHREALDLEDYATAPLSADTLRSLTYLRDVEHATMNHLRNVLVTPTHKDARVTAFLITWAFEKFWISDAISEILKVHDAFEAPTQSAGNRFGGIFRSIRERLAPIKESMVANQIGVDMIAVHMAMGAIDGWLTQSAYARVAELEAHPTLSRIIDTIITVKARHLTFFEPQAEHRLEGSARAQSLTRKRLRAAEWPTASGDQPQSETRFFFSRLIAPVPDVVAAIDAKVDALPGLAGLGLIARRVRTVG